MFFLVKYLSHACSNNIYDTSHAWIKLVEHVIEQQPALTHVFNKLKLFLYALIGKRKQYKIYL